MKSVIGDREINQHTHTSFGLSNRQTCTNLLPAMVSCSPYLTRSLICTRYDKLYFEVLRYLLVGQTRPRRKNARIKFKSAAGTFGEHSAPAANTRQYPPTQPPQVRLVYGRPCSAVKTPKNLLVHRFLSMQQTVTEPPPLPILPPCTAVVSSPTTALQGTSTAHPPLKMLMQ